MSAHWYDVADIHATVPAVTEGLIVAYSGSVGRRVIRKP